MPFSKRYLLVPVLLTAGLALAGCSGSSSMAGMDHGSTPMPSSPMQGMGSTPSGPATAGSSNDADAMFAQMMVPHHEQAVSMSETLLSKSGVDARVVSLATRIKSAQQPEIDRLRSWLASWNQPTSAPAGHSMDGMMSADDMARLDAAQGPAAAKLFLTQMIAHHEGAVAMARTEAASGMNPEAVAMAKSIVGSQSAEITEMKALLASL